MKKVYSTKSLGESAVGRWGLPAVIATMLFLWAANLMTWALPAPSSLLASGKAASGFALSIVLILAVFGLYINNRLVSKKRLQKLRPVYPAADDLSVLREQITAVIKETKMYRSFWRNVPLNFRLKDNLVYSILLVLGIGMGFSAPSNATNFNGYNTTPKVGKNGNPDAACSLTIDKVSVGECRNDAATGFVPKVLVAVFVSWTMPPAGETINITVDGVTKTINPSVNGCEPYQQFLVNADGSTQSADAEFSGGTCSAPSILFDVPPACTGSAPCSGPTAIGGTVYSDFDSDGIKDASEFGIPGAKIDLFDSNENLLCSATADFQGRWTCTGLTNGQKVRVEISNIPLPYNPSGIGADNDGGVVQFATVGSNCTVDFGLLKVADYCADNPYIITPCYLRGDPLAGGTSGDLDVLVAVPYNAPNNGSASNIYLAKNKEIGPTWGVAYQKDTKKIFSSAFLKRHCGWGPDSLGAIYLTDASTLPLVSGVPPSTYINLEQYGITTAKEFTLTRNLGPNLNQPSHDAQVFDLVGKWGLGDLDISDDGDSLFVVNLYNRSLVTMAIGNPAVYPVPASAVSEVSIPAPPGVPSGDWRPFALKYKDGILYIGGVSSAQSTQDATDLYAYIYAFNPSFGTFTEVLSFPLDYSKGIVLTGLSHCTNWNPWTSNFSNLPAGGIELCYPQPILSDIEFDVYGNMMVAFNDRAGHQGGWYDYGTNVNQFNTYKGNAGGDILRVVNNNGTWLIERNGVAGYDTGCGVGNGQGPCGGEFYCQDSYLSAHQEAVHGGIAIHPSNNELLLNMMDATSAFSGGLAWYNNATGVKNRAYRVYFSDNNGNSGLLGKAAGLGDLEILCGLAPIELGNYVWVDTDRDGIQDPDEAPIQGVNVSLYQGNTLKKTVVTSPTGQFKFVEADGVLPNTNYCIAFGTGGQFSGGNLTVGGKSYKMTLTNIGFGANDDNNDSDVSPGTGNLPAAILGLPVVCLNSGARGENNNTLDAGFFPVIDYGDLADDNTAGSYPTDLTDGAGEGVGPSHQIIPTLKLGASVDEESDGQPSALANGDDTNGSDDENGVSFPTFQLGIPANVTVSLMNMTGGGAKLTLFIDWNNNKVLDNAGEMFSTTVANNATSYTFTGITPPAGAPLNTNLGVRVRLSTNAAASMLPTGAAPDGEVEDYLVQVIANDYGDLPDSGPGTGVGNYQTTLADNGPCHKLVANLKLGASVDNEVDGLQSALSNGDDTNGADDENGVTFPTMTAGLPAVIPISVMNMTGQPAALFGFFDWNKDGDFADANEVFNVTVADGTNGNVNLNINVPINAVPNMNLGARFRLSTDLLAASLPIGCAPDGEVEDYLVQVECPSITVTPVVTNVSCFGGSNGGITITVNGGASPYSYDWSNDGPENPDNDSQNLTGVPAGTYTVTVTDASGCTGTVSATVTQPTLISLSTSVVNVLCREGNNGAVDLSASGGTFPYTYDWSNDGPDNPDNDNQDINGLVAGTYTVTVTDLNGCSATISAAISQPAQNLTLSASVMDVTCNNGSNGSINLTVNGGTPAYSYDWSNDGGENPDNDPQDISGLTAGLYEVTVTDANGCTNQLPVTVNEPTPLQLSTVVMDVPCTSGNNGGIDLTVAGGSPGYTYDWSNDGPENPDNDPQDLTNVLAGTYTVTVTDVNGCTATIEITVDQPMEGLSLDVAVISANCSGTLDLTVGGGTPGYTYDWSNDGPENPDNDTEDITVAAAGTYTVTVTDANGCTASVSAPYYGCDHGDLPDTGAGTSAGNYQTSGSDNGPTHDIVPGIKLGASVDAEANGLPSGLADGDDSNGSDDENGVNAFPMFVAGNTANLSVNVMNMNGNAIGAKLTVFVDWNNDGDFNDANEMFSTTVSDNTNGTIVLPITVPINVVTGTNLGLRIRLSTDPNASMLPTGPAPDGEVEDYLVQAMAFDYGDLNDLNNPGSYPTNNNNGSGEGLGASHKIIPGLRIGSTVDAEGDGQPNSGATGDGSDEDGVTLPMFLANETVNVPVSVLNTTGADAKVVVFVDWNGNGTFGDAGEMFFVTVPTGTNGIVNVPVTAPANAILNVNIGVRVRLSNDLTGVMNPTGQVSSGEVEDYVAQVMAFDYGDLPDSGNGTGASNYQTNASDNGPSHKLAGNLKMGSSVEYESNGQPNSGANGDDNAGVDDENGVTFPAMQAGVPAVVTVNAMNMSGEPAVVFGFFDWNNDGDFADANEIASVTIPDGTNGNVSLNISIPANAIPNVNLGARFRISTDLLAASAPVESAPDGEVEDYLIQVSCPTITLSTEVTNVTCNQGTNGSIDLSINGGTGPYTYDWSNDGPENPDNDPQDLSGLAAGTYTVTVTDANGCTATTSATVEQPTPIVLNAAVVTNEGLCGEKLGSIDLTVSGGTPAYTFDWSNDGPDNPDNDPEDLSNLAAGTYTVTITDANGCTTTASATITCIQPASIGNYVWEDMNANGIQDGTEPPIPNVVVILEGTTINGTFVNQTTATDGNGLYLFDYLYPGNYKLTFITPTGGYVPTRANDAQASDSNDSDADPEMGGMTAVETLVAGENNLTYDAGYYIPASIGNFVWEDLNANGIQEPGEPAISNALVFISGTDGQGNPYGSATYTDVDGSYLFDNLVPGSYKLTFVSPAGYVYTGDNQGANDAIDSDADNLMGGMTVFEVLESGEYNPDYDAGFYVPASLGDYVWIDENANGVQESGEAPLQGVTVKLQNAAGNPVTVDASGNPIVNQVTNAAGFYEFDNLVPGTYQVMFVNPDPAKYTLTTVNAGTDDAQDSDPTAPGLMTQTTTLNSGENDPTLDAGFFVKAKVGDFVWQDLNGNGIQDNGEPGINGVPVTLTGTDNQGNPVNLTVNTSGNGMYMFGDLVPGSYKITFPIPAGGYVRTPADQGGSDELDSDANTMGMTPVFTVTSGDTIPTFDAGFYIPASIGNYTWIDLNADGDQDGNEPPLPGVVVILTGTTGTGQAINQTATTDANGLYLFPGLQPGTYKLTFQTPIGGYVSTTPNDPDANDTNDSDADPAMGGMTVNEVLVSGENNLTYDAGYYQPASIGDFVWHDLDGDGIQDPNEPGIADVTVTLTGTDGQGNPVTLSTTTAPDGSYLFPNLVPGTYKLTFTTPAGGYVSSDVNEGGNDANDSDADPAMGGMTVNEVLTSGEYNPTYDAGYYIPAEIGNYTWIDANANGIQDMGESPIANVSVTLTGTTASGDPVNLNDVTDANGLYLFTGLEPGTYKLTFVTPAGYVATLANDVDDATDALDSDADPANGGMTVNEVLTSGESNLTYDAGYYEYASIGNYTWIDTDADGVQDPTELPLPGVTVTLTGTDGQGNPVTLTDVTDNNGLYLFDDLVPGTYKLTFTTPGGGYVPTDANQGGNDATDSDADPVMGGMTVFEVLVSGEDNLTYDAGYYLPAEIGNYTWIDSNADGDQDPGESPLPGVVVILDGTTGSGEPVNQTATTDANGLYLFDNLQPGTYKLTFQTPVGNYVSTTANDVDATDATDSDADPANGGMTVFEVLTSGESNLTYDAGYYEPASIGDFVWNDQDADGVQDGGEPGIGGVLVTLTGTDGQGNPVSLTTTTAPDGSYNFPDLVPGTYKLTFSAPAGFDFASPLDAGGNDATDSDANPAMGGMTVNEILESGEHNPTYDAGFYQCPVVSVLGLPINPVCPGAEVGPLLIKAEPYAANVSWSGGSSIGLADGNAPGPWVEIPAFVTTNEGAPTITVTATLGQCTVTETFVINVDDSTPPVIQDCPADITVGNDVDKCGANVTFNTPTAVDNCDGNVTVTQTQGPISGSLFPVGTTTITFVADDGNGNTVSCQFTITVTDMQTPTAVCKDITVNLSSTTNGGTVTVTAAQVNGGSTDNCTPAANLVLAPASTTYTCANVGDRLITLTVTDAAGNTSTCVATVTVNDASAPVITVCPANVTVNDCDDVVPAMTTQLTATDNCGVASVTQNPVAGTDFGQVNGNSVIVTFTVTDVNGNVSTCTNTITIVDNVPPVLTNCPTSITVGNDVDKCGSNVFWTAPTATDNCASNVTITQSSTPAGFVPGSLFPVGTTTITYVANDGNGNTVSCTFNITVTDMQAPNAVCKDITVNLSSTTNGGTVTVTAAQVNGGSTDNCTPAANLVLAPASTTYTCANVGDRLITLTVTDAAGNTSTCVATVTVNDASAPVITVCPANVTVNDCDDVVPSMTGQLTATDNCGIASVTQNPVAGTDFGQVNGNSVIVTFTVTDVNGNTSTCTNTITIVDDVKPVLENCPASITVGNDVDKCGSNVFWTAPTATDNCASNVTITQSSTPAGFVPGSLFPVGTTTITYVANDGNGNTVSCTFNITVTDMQAPNAVCKDITVNLSSTTNGGTVTVTAAQVNGGSTDNCTPAANLVLAPASTTYTCANVGDRLITLTVTDAAGNTSTCVATVTVNDASAPVITVCPANVTVNDCDDVVPSLTGQLTATDNCGVASVTQNPVAGTDFGQVNGNSVIVTFTVTDVNGNVSTCTNTITIVDDVKPVLENCPASITVGNDVDKCGANVFWTAPTAVDNCASNVTVTQTSTPAGFVPGSLFPVGTTTITYVANDGNGNTVSCTFSITVTDMQAPNAVCKDITVNLSSTTNGGTVTVTAAQVNGGSTDNCTPAANLVLAPANTTYTCANVGDNLITLTVTDAAGNTSTCVATVTVKDVTPPVFTCPAPVTVPSCTSTVPNVLNGLTATDNCGVASITQNPVAGTDFGQVNGNTVIVTVTVTDVNGNVSTCPVVVTILDAGPPVFVDCPTSMIMIGNDPDQCSGKVNWAIPVALDECLPLANVIQTAGPVPGSVVPITCPPTPTTISYKATDGAGNMATCSFQVMVIDTEKPEFDADILMPGNVTVECDAVPTNCIPRTGGACTPLTVSDVNDNCAGPLTVAFNQVSTQDPNPANCGHYNYTITRTWTVTDCADNALIAAGLPPTHQLIHVQVITVRDTKAPTALCKNATVALDKTGRYILNPSEVNNGSFDNCAATQYLTFSVSPSQFTCANLGANLVTLTVTDPCGNAATCQATITVTEGIAPCTPLFNVATVCGGNMGMGNATTLDNGQFQDIITVKALAMQTWRITINNGGLYNIASPAPPASPVLLPVGTVFTAGTADGIDNDGDGSTDEADEMIYYTLRAIHVDCQGYDITVSNAGAIGLGLSATTTRIQNKACYPTPYFSNLLEDFYCLGTPPFTIQVGEYNNAAGSIVPGSVMIDGVPTTEFNAGSLGLGAHTVMATFDAGAPTQNLVITGHQWCPSWRFHARCHQRSGL